MATIFLIGSNDPLLEGIAQTLAASGHQPRICHSVAESLDTARTDPPLAVVVERSLAVSDLAALRIPVAPGGATLLFKSGAESPGESLPLPVQRLVMAELTLPLERHRLVTLIQRMEERRQATGRGRRGHDTPPENHALP
jgi:DNA-binding NtrC family response regulator